MKDLVRKEIIGTRAGNAIRFTCPDCQTANSITYNMPKEFFQKSRAANCSSCRKRFTILTPDGSRIWKPRRYVAPIVR